MQRADLIRQLRGHLVAEMSFDAGTAAQASDDLVLLLPFCSTSVRGRWPSPHELEQAVASCETLETFLAAADVWKAIAQAEAERGFGRSCFAVVEPCNPPVNMT